MYIRYCSFCSIHCVTAASPTTLFWLWRARLFKPACKMAMKVYLEYFIIIWSKKKEAFVRLAAGWGCISEDTSRRHGCVLCVQGKECGQVLDTGPLSGHVQRLTLVRCGSRARFALFLRAAVQTIYDTYLLSWNPTKFLYFNIAIMRLRCFSNVWTLCNFCSLAMVRPQRVGGRSAAASVCGKTCEGK